MTKKHFIALADTLRATRPSGLGTTIMNSDAQLIAGQWIMDRDALADFCKSQNSQFNRERWLGYIAGENGKNGGKV